MCKNQSKKNDAEIKKRVNEVFVIQNEYQKDVS